MKKEGRYPGIKYLIKYYKKHLFFLVCYSIILIVQAVASFFDAMFIAKTVTYMMDATYSKAITCAGVTLGLSLFICLLSVSSTYFFKNLENRVKIDIQQGVIKHSLDIQMKDYDEMGSGIIVTRLTHDIYQLSVGFKSVTTRIVQLMTKVAFVIYAFFLNVWLGLFLFGTIVIMILLYSVRVYYLRKLKVGVKAASENVNSKIIEVIRGVEDIKVLNCAENTCDLLMPDQLEFARRDNHEWYVGVSLYNVTTAFSKISSFIFILLCVYFLRMDALTPVIFYTCYLYKDKIMDFATILGDLKIDLGEIEISAQRIFKLVDESTYTTDKFGDKYIEDFTGRIEFKDVRFEYTNQKPILNDTSFVIQPKHTVAFVGESGSGKTTIINLISHLYYKNSGEIYFDDVKLEDLSKKFIKENIAVVNQFPYIFNISIRENFRLIKSNITDEEILELCKKTRIYDHIMSLPNKLDSVMGEGGSQFSGGQRQKLCIARALARHVKILIFDEATSSLDNSSQADIMEIIEKLKNEMTIIIIAHRLSTITYADCIYLLEKGKVITQGTHKELMKNSTLYKTLFMNESKLKEAEEEAA